jgi:hypothetical protein
MRQRMQRREIPGRGQGEPFGPAVHRDQRHEQHRVPGDPGGGNGEGHTGHHYGAAPGLIGAGGAQNSHARQGKHSHGGHRCPPARGDEAQELEPAVAGVRGREENKGCRSVHVLSLERLDGRSECDGGEPDQHYRGGEAQPGAQLGIADRPVEQ